MESKKIVRNNTSFPLQINAKLKELYDVYKNELEKDDDSVNWAKNLKYYQYLVKELISNDIVSEHEYARGLLIYHTMGMGKTRLAVAVAMSCWDMYQPVILLPQNLKKNFKNTVKQFSKLLANGKSDSEIEKKALDKFQFVSMDAYNSSTQMENIGNQKHLDLLSKVDNLFTKKENKEKKEKKRKKGGNNYFQNGLDNKLLIVDEAHNFFRAIINSGSENSNARKIYEAIMSAKNLKILFLTGTPSSKDPFELVPCFNMLAGKNLLPTAYDTFYNLYINKPTGSINNKNKLANRILGLVSHVTHNKNSQPVAHSEQNSIIHKKDRDVGWFPECKPTIISYVEMSAMQYKQYLLARDRENAEKGRGKGGKTFERVNSTPLALPNSEKKSMGSYYVKSRMLSNFSPHRDYKDSPIDLIPNNMFNETTSPKFKLIADRIKIAKGSTLVYSQFVDKGGLRPLTKYLENIGMTEFTIDDIKKHSHILKNYKFKNKPTDDLLSIPMSSMVDVMDDSNINLSIIHAYTHDNVLNSDKEFDKNFSNELDLELNGKIIGGDNSCSVCTIDSDNYTVMDSIESMTNQEFEYYANRDVKPKKLKSKKNAHTYIIYGADLYFTQLEKRLSAWKKIESPNKEIVDFAWGNLLPEMHYDRNFFNQKAKLKNILMNSKSIISDKSKLYKTCDSFMKKGKYIPKTYDLHTFKIADTTEIPMPSNKNPYIVKDATSFGQKGVHIITSIEELEKYKKQLRHTSAIISEYMTDPLLWRGKKFHFRIYVGVYVSKKTKKQFIKVFHNSNYAFKIFMAKDKFIAGDYHNEDIHITGRKSTLKRHQWIIVPETPNSSEKDDFYFSSNDLPNGVSFEDINKKINKMFIDTITPHLGEFEEYPECDAGFEIFGADVILNNKGEPFILEINAKIGYSADYGEKDGARQYHEEFSHDFFNWVYDNFIKI
jgi:hypothetical protein